MRHLSGMAAEKPQPRKPRKDRRKAIREADVTGLKYFDRLAPLLARLHDDGCQRDKAGNRDLHFDQYCMLVLLFMFNPVVSSLRAMQQASELKKVQQKLGCGRASLGSLSESSRIFNPQLLREVIAELGEQLEPVVRDPRLSSVPHTLTAVDGSLLTALPLLVEATQLNHTAGSGLVKWRLHAQFEIENYVPTRIDVTRNGGGQLDEKAVLRRTLQANRCYIQDRGYAKFTLFNEINAIGSSYVCRLRDNSVYDIVEARELSAEALAAGVLQDAVVQLGKASKADARPDHAMRLITIKTTPHVKRGKYKGGSTGHGSDGVLRIATNLLDVPPEIIGLIFQYRWTIEIFFRFFKHVLGCRHLISHSAGGIEIQTYCAIIACMLISLWTGSKPTKRTYEMICYFFTGLADEEELLAHLAKLKRHDA
jgi:hypothetical protein